MLEWFRSGLHKLARRWNERMQPGENVLKQAQEDSNRARRLASDTKNRLRKQP